MIPFLDNKKYIVLAPCLCVWLWGASIVVAGQENEAAQPQRTIQLPPSPSEPQMQELAQRQFEISTKEVLPLTPGQIKEYKRAVAETTQAARPTEPPTIVTRSAKLSIEPGATPPSIQVVPGCVTAVLFYDSSGAPWPIASISEVTELFDINHNEDLEPGNQVTIGALARYGNTNCTITLKDQSLPVVLQIKTDDRDVGAIHDGAVVFQATMRGPLAEKPMIGGVKATSTVDEIMLGFVDGIPPKGAEYLPCTPEFDGVGVWEYEGQLYVRTRHAAVWPAWTMVANGTGDIRVYKMPVVPSIILSKGGATHTLNIIQEGQNG